MPGKEQLGNSPQEADSGLPQKDQELFTPRFSFTKDIVKRFQDAGITQEHYEPFARNFDTYLKQAANTENLVAIGIIAVPSTEDYAEYIIADGGYAIDGVAYWSLKKEGMWKNNPAVGKLYADWSSLTKDSLVVDNKLGLERRLVDAVHLETLSQDTYPTIEAVREALEDNDARNDFTLTADNCEFWGLVTTEELRQEMAVK